MMNKCSKILDIGTTILVIVLIFDLLNDWGNSFYLGICIGLSILISGVMSLFNSKEWGICISQSGAEWKTPSKSTEIKFSDIESIFCCEVENKMVFVSKSGKSCSVPSKCIEQNRNVFIQMRKIVPNLITWHEVAR